MTILEFIRKNSILVIIVIFGVGAGLVMMDYAGKGSMFSRDFYIKVNNTGYSYPETSTLGENGREFLVSLVHATREITEQFDADGNGEFSEEETAALRAWQNEHPEYAEFYGMLNNIYGMWTYGPAHEDYVNVAITRAMLKAEADALGLHPSEQQIDDYLRSMPIFTKQDGSFNTELYQRMTGFRRGHTNRVQEELFRDLIADIIIWKSLQAIVTDGVSYNSKTQLAQLDAFLQSVSGRTAWLPGGAAPTPEEPTEDELRAYWEEHKEAYKSEERRIVSVYTLSPGTDSNMESLLTTTDFLMQDLSLANGQGLDKLLTDAANNPEYEPFNYLSEDGSTHRTYPLSTREQLRELLNDEVNYDGTNTTLADVVFEEVKDAPTVEDYTAAVENGNAEKYVSIKQIRGPYTAQDNKVKMLRIEAIQAPTTLTYDEARGKALADFRAERAANALKIAAEELYSNMQAIIKEQGMNAAFTMAAEAGATVENYGPLQLANVTTPLPSGVTDANILSTPSGQLTPLIITETGARITSVDKRTVEDSPALSMQKRFYRLPYDNSRLRQNLMLDWWNASYSRYKVQLSDSVRLHNSN